MPMKHMLSEMITKMLLFDEKDYELMNKYHNKKLEEEAHQRLIMKRKLWMKGLLKKYNWKFSFDESQNKVIASTKLSKNSPKIIARVGSLSSSLFYDIVDSNNKVVESFYFWDSVEYAVGKYLDELKWQRTRMLGD